ncbi:MAG: GGDEF domain-containing protein [Sphaerochaetaceae bacterium]|nr:GGDEF domain-containing protein [Sphaerochaetaceae bacterium]
MELKRAFRKDMEISGEYVQRYSGTYSVLLSVICFFELVMIIRGIAILNFAKAKHVQYFCSYVFLLVISLGALVVIQLSRRDKVKLQTMGHTVSLYAFFILCWAVLISYLDMVDGNFPIVYLTIAITIGGIAVITPPLFILDVASTFAALIILDSRNTTPFFHKTGNIINIVVFLSMAIIMCFRQYRVSRKESEERKILSHLSYTDQLTGLGNETAYYRQVDKISSRIEAGNAEFAIVMMDVNNVKATNDSIGHRYGCHLIVTAGKTLPNIFTTSKLYHIGGDEFVAIVSGDDYHNLLQRLDEFDKELEYKKIIYNGKELILSVARGYFMYEKGMKYSDVLQNADNAMYANKMQIKKAHNLSER